MSPKPLKDFLYLDLEKLSSLYSQVDDGLVESISTTLADSSSVSPEMRIRLGLIEGKIGGASDSSHLNVVTKSLHHHVENLVEDRLDEEGRIYDLNTEKVGVDKSLDDIRESIAGHSFVRARGKIVFEDFGRIKHISDNYQDLAELIGRAVLSEDLEFARKLGDLNSEKEKLVRSSNKNDKAKIAHNVEVLEYEISSLAKKATGEVPEWILDNIRTFIDVLAPNKLMSRCAPLDHLPELQIVSNLKSTSFVDASVENITSSYGRVSNVDVNVFGIVTSVPSVGESDGENIFQREFSRREEIGLTGHEDDLLQYEKVFRNMFFAMDGIFSFMKFSSYPAAVIYPISIYRDL